MLSTIDATADDKLTRFALRLAFAGHVGIPGEGEFDFLTEAATVFLPLQPRKEKKLKKPPTPIKKESKKAAPKKKIAA